MDQQIESPNLNQTDNPPQLGFQSSPLDPDLHLTCLDVDDYLHQELLNQLDLKNGFPNSNYSNEEEKEEEAVEDIKSEESDKKSENENFDESESIEKLSGADDAEKKNDIEDANINAYDNSNYNNRFHQYPVRPEAEDCAFYMKTGTCKFGANCKFNHPVRRKNQAVKERVKEGEEATEKPGQTECKYYLRTGGCKYGKACRFNHSRARTSVPPLNTSTSPILELNFLGLPIRLGERECEYYMRNGSCKYGANCKYNHPDPTAVGVSDPPTFANGVSVALPVPSPSSVGSWSSPRALNDPSPFMPTVFSPTQGVPSQSPEWNGYQAPLYPPERSLHPPPSYVIGNPASESNVYAPQQHQILVDEFPERPGQPLCSFFMKFGDCKFKSNCKYHHPKNRISESPSLTLNDKGLPLRPDQNICSHYSRYGICKFGPACKFDHSIHPVSSIGSGDDQHAACGNSVTQEEARMDENRSGPGAAVEQPL